jgi:hypothetical protein
MASSRPAQRRGPAPAQLTTQTKNILSVEDWEAKAPLSDLEIRSINLIKIASEKVPLPVKVGNLSSNVLALLGLMSSSLAQTMQDHLDHLRQVRLSVTGFKAHVQEHHCQTLHVQR